MDEFTCIGLMNAKTCSSLLFLFTVTAIFSIIATHGNDSFQKEKNLYMIKREQRKGALRINYPQQTC